MTECAICVTCGTQYAPGPTPDACAICCDERQYVAATGQAWTTLSRLRRSHMACVRMEGALLGIGIAPAFGIGQRALLVRTPAGNILWDCISLVDDALVTLIGALGGLAGIAISHPHYYTTCVEWSRAFGGVPVHLHAADREWIMRPDPAIVAWEGEMRPLLPGLTLVRAGGHYPGGTVLHWADGNGGAGALLSGDIVQVVADRQHVGFMRSYPNFIPLGAAAVSGIARRLSHLSFDAIYGAFWNLVIPTGGRAAFDRSVARHLDWLARPDE